MGCRSRLCRPGTVTESGGRSHRKSEQHDGNPGANGCLNADIDDYDARIEALISDDDDLVIHIEQLESIVDDINDDEDSSGPIDLSESDDLLNEVEQFLRERDNEN